MNDKTKATPAIPSYITDAKVIEDKNLGTVLVGIWGDGGWWAFTLHGDHWCSHHQLTLVEVASVTASQAEAPTNDDFLIAHDDDAEVGAAEAPKPDLREALEDSTELLRSLVGTEANECGAIDEQIKTNAARLAAAPSDEQKLREGLAQALRQWRSYYMDANGDDIDTADHVEGVMYRRLRNLAKVGEDSQS